MLKYRLIAISFVLLYFIAQTYYYVPFLQVIAILIFAEIIYLTTQNNKIFDTIKNESILSKNTKDLLCMLLLIIMALLIYMGLFLLNEIGYIREAYIVMTSICFFIWLFVDYKISSAKVKIFPEKFPERLKYSITIIFLCLLFAEIFTVYPGGSFWFFGGIIYILINLLTYFISIVSWKDGFKN